MTRAGYLFELCLLWEGGQAPGTMDLASISLADARAFAEKVFVAAGTSLDSQIPNFDANFKLAQKKSQEGTMKRKDMPVLENHNVWDLQERLQAGYIDVSKPFSPDHKDNPFPQGLSGDKAKQWLKDGLSRYDGSAEDDKVEADMQSLRVGDLIPIQKQIYFDKSITATAKEGVEDSKFYIESQIFVVSSDLHIMDGHHRFLSAVLIDPDMKVNCLVIALPLDKFLPMAVAYSDAVGNKRNESLEMSMTGIRVSVNPRNTDAISHDLLMPIEDVRRSAGDPSLRTLADLQTGDIYIWPAFEKTHTDMAPELGLDISQCAEGYGAKPSFTGGLLRAKNSYLVPPKFSECIDRVNRIFSR